MNHLYPAKALSNDTLPELMAQVYESAPASERARMVEQLIRPLGVLSLMAVAHGVFARIRLRGGWPDTHVQLKDVLSVRTQDVTDLVDHLQYLGAGTLDGLARCIVASPLLAGSAAAGLLVSEILRRSKAKAARAGA